MVCTCEVGMVIHFRFFVTSRIVRKQVLKSPLTGQNDEKNKEKTYLRSSCIGRGVDCADTLYIHPPSKKETNGCPLSSEGTQLLRPCACA